MTDLEYHLAELAIARDPSDRRRSLPPVLATDRRVLDVGCGLGQTLASAGFHPGTALFGVDVDAVAVARGARMFPALHLAAAAAEALPARTGSFDLVVCRVAMPFTDVPAAVRELFRVLAPGGRAWFVLHTWRAELRELREAVRARSPRDAAVAVYAAVNGILLHAVGRVVPNPVTRKYRSFQTQSGFTRLMRRAGFVDCAAEPAIEGALTFTASKPGGARPAPALPAPGVRAILDGA